MSLFCSEGSATISGCTGTNKAEQRMMLSSTGSDRTVNQLLLFGPVLASLIIFRELPLGHGV